MGYAALVAVVLALGGAGVALYFRSEARRWADRCTFLDSRAASLQRSLVTEVEARLDEVRKLESVIVQLRASLKENEDDLLALLRDNPGLAGVRLKRVLSAGADSDVSDHPVVQAPTGSTGARRGRKPRGG